MQDKMLLVDKELVALATVLPDLDIVPASIGAIRQSLEDQFASQQAGQGISGESVQLPTGDGSVIRALFYRGRSAPASAPAFLNIHGGGFLFGSPEWDDATNRNIADELGIVVVSVDYRLCPEHPFPIPLHDCYAALQWMHDNSGSLGIDPGRIGIGGGSAGGGLAAALALLARDRGEIALRCQILTYPMLDDRTGRADGPALFPHVGQLSWTPANNCAGWSGMLGAAAGGPDVSPHASPARAESLTGLPPTFIAVGDIDLFLQEDLEYARRLMASAVPTELHVYAGAIHGFELAADSTVARNFQRDRLAALKRMLLSDG